MGLYDDFSLLLKALAGIPPPEPDGTIASWGRSLVVLNPLKYML